jgi:DNA-binding CsgD family transcriptional regulator
MPTTEAHPGDAHEALVGPPDDLAITRVVDVAGWQPTVAPPGLVGRDRERDTIDRVLARAESSEGQALVLTGPAGIGKTALLEYACERAHHMTVLRATGIERESNLAFAGLHGLVRPIGDVLDELPDVQSGALRGAFGLVPAQSSDRFLVSAALLDLLATASERRPVVCLVDDAHWLDRPSLDALMFTARRLGAERLALLFAARDGGPERFEATGLEELTLAGLDDVASARLISRTTVGAAPTVRDRLLAEALGNPLALLELPGGLSEGQLKGDDPLPNAIPLTPRLRRVFDERIKRLPNGGRDVLLLTAADNTGELATILRAATELGLPSDALDIAERAGLINTGGGRLAFRHPLVRSTVYDGATVSERQRAHAVLAESLTGNEHAERRVWHQAMAATPGDEAVASALEASATRSQQRAAHASAAVALLKAADLSTDGAVRTRRLAAAADAAWTAGRAQTARAAATQALRRAEGELLANLLHLSGVIEARTGDLRDAYDRLLEGIDVTGNPSLKLEMLIDAAEAGFYAGDITRVVALADRIGTIKPATSRDRLIIAVFQGQMKVGAGDHQHARTHLANALEHADDVDDPRALLWAARAASFALDNGNGLPYANKAVAQARRDGLHSLLPLALEQQTTELITESKLDLAHAAAQEGYRVALDVGYSPSVHLAHMAMVEAIWGRYADARAHGEQALALGLRANSTFLTSFARWALGYSELTQGRPEDAARQLLAITALDSSDFNPLCGYLAMPDGIEAAMLAGDRDAAFGLLQALDDWVVLAPTPARRALLARSQALLDARPPGDAFAEALELASALSPFQRGRTALQYGEWLRRQRRRRDARVRLSAAQELLSSIGARPLAGRAAAELRATGETVRRRDSHDLNALTPRELQIATLVAEGLTNRDIAAQLYLSHRTVDYHLHKVFGKLGITSRVQLVRDGVPQRDDV